MRVFASLLLGLCLIAGCTEEEPPLAPKDRQAVSQRYADSIRLLAKQIDSICDAQRPELAAALSDSLYQQRLNDLLNSRAQAR